MRFEDAARSRRGALLASALVFASIGGFLLWPLKPSPHAAATQTAGPPWVYGRRDARFTLIEYADLECPYCRAYLPVMRRWIDSNPDVNWQWHHLPLSIHEPAATEDARLAECAGESGGNAAFWRTVDWIYSHTRGDGGGLAPSAKRPGASAAMRACLESERPDALILAQVDDAAHDAIAATPTLRLIDHRTNKVLMFYGAADGAALSSAVDFLASPHDDATGSGR